MGEHVQRLSVRNEFVIGMDLKAIACTIPARSTKHQRDPQSPAGLHGNLLHAMLAAARSPLWWNPHTAQRAERALFSGGSPKVYRLAPYSTVFPLSLIH